MSKNVNVFISYAHEDSIIANAIKDQLTLLAQRGKGGPSLNCFLDTESIQPGVKYEPVIRAALDGRLAGRRTHGLSEAYIAVMKSVCIASSNHSRVNPSMRSLWRASMTWN